MGYFGVGMNVAMAIGPALGVFLVGWTGYGSLFLTAMVLGAAAALTTAGIAEPRRAPGQGALQRGWRSFILPSALFPSAVLFTNALTYASVVALLPLFADEAGLGNPGLFFTVFSVVVLVLRGRWDGCRTGAGGWRWSLRGCPSRSWRCSYSHRRRARRRCSWWPCSTRSASAQPNRR